MRGNTRGWSTKKKRPTKSIGRLRIEHRRQTLLRMMFIGWSTKRSAKALHRTEQTVRQMIATPEYQSAYTLYAREMFSILDRKMPRLLVSTIRALDKTLRHKDWPARALTAQKILALDSTPGSAVAVLDHETLTRVRHANMLAG